MIDKVMIDGQQVELTKDMFEMAPANFGDNEAISRPSLTFWHDGKPISDDDLLRFINQLLPLIQQEHLSMFEIDTLIMLYYFNGNICTYVF